MEIVKNAYAGTLESSDAFVQIIKTEQKGVKIELESSVKEIYGDDIIKLIQNIIKKMDLQDVYLKVQDKGALDFVIEARVQAAILRACEVSKPDWSKL